MIDGSEKRNRQLAFELQNSHVCEKRGKKHRLKKKKTGKLTSPSRGVGIAETVLNVFVPHSLPWMGKKTVSTDESIRSKWFK